MWSILQVFVLRALAQSGPQLPPLPTVDRGITPGGGNSAIQLPNPLGISSLEALLDRIVTGLIYIAIPVVTLMILIGAFKMLFSGGSSDKFSEGKDTIVYALIGLIAVLLARGVADIIVFIFR